MLNDIESNTVEKNKKLKLFSIRKSLGDVIHFFPSMGLAKNCTLTDSSSVCTLVNVKNTIATADNCLTVSELKDLEGQSPCPDCMQFILNA